MPNMQREKIKTQVNYMSCCFCCSQANIRIDSALLSQGKVDLLEAASNLSRQMTHITFKEKTKPQVKIIKNLIKKGNKLIAPTRLEEKAPPSFIKIDNMKESKRQNLYSRICEIRNKLLKESCPEFFDQKRTDLFHLMKYFYLEFKTFENEFKELNHELQKDSLQYESVMMREFIFQAKKCFIHLTVGQKEIETRSVIDNLDESSFNHLNDFFKDFQNKLNEYFELLKTIRIESQAIQVNGKYLTISLVTVMESNEIRERFFQNSQIGIGVPDANETHERLYKVKSLKEVGFPSLPQKNGDAKTGTNPAKQAYQFSRSLAKSKSTYLEPEVFARYLNPDRSK